MGPLNRSEEPQPAAEAQATTGGRLPAGGQGDLVKAIAVRSVLCRGLKLNHGS